MAKDPLLRDAVRAIKAKIEAAAAVATPEELAYLGTAIDRIGGRATLLEVEDLGDVKMDEITALAAQRQADTIAAIDSSAGAAVAHVNATQTAATNAINATRTAAQAAITQTQNSATTQVTAAAQTAIQQAELASSQAIASAQAAAHSITQQLVLGRKTFFLAQL